MANRTLPRLLQAPAVLMLLMWMLVPLGMTLFFSFIPLRSEQPAPARMDHPVP
jgi:ABC-type sugar transport system permease subunit